ncbi:lasso peptide biosynthesis PqqD family chaperone [Lentzea jiangxiensis]|uniref:Coenzyme PQQ synthesis protein D (PqqD) n=1 Tax=Lentzea jiangxiensis TaxID=641025 RepID=A0A1H0TT41_9PSEU|nr:lasso peptide biosynthesis PqqD family chaperone [Lentzea jiangxiensis]SDP57031.1 Coenzyme PQQ synthesis protein D (PqqD) [Lentzea jiangxiensis]
MTLRPRTQVSMTRAEDGMVVLDERTGRYWQLNSTAAYVLERLTAGDTADQIAERIAASAGVDVADVRSDVDVFVGHLRSADLIAG